MRHVRTAVVLAFLGSLVPGLPADPGGSGSTLESVLRSERQQAVDRRQLLTGLRKTPNPAARWQSGFVDFQSEWQPFETARLSGAEATRREEYHQRRRAVQESASGQFALAEWCRTHDLPAQEYAHKLAGVLLSPEQDHRATLNELGFQEVSDVWLTPEEFAAWQTEVQLTRESLAEWGDKLTHAVDLLQAGGGRKRQAALRLLDQVRDRRCVPALELTFAGQTEPVGLLAIERLRQIDAFEATKSLARQAVFNRRPAVREAATEGLFDRRYEDFVPDLLSLLTTTIDSQIVRMEDNRGYLIYSYVVARETESQFQVATFETIAAAVPPPPIVIEYGRISGRLRVRSSGDANLTQRLTFERAFADQAYLESKRLDRLNEQTQELNARVTDVLASVSGETKRETPRDWWDWWDGYNQYEKKAKRVRKVERKRYVGPVAQGLTPIRLVQGASCLAAGTPVWTDDGPTPVEKLQVGDSVLTQDVESGELGYLPVLQTTVREPTTVYRLTLSGEVLTATGGHRFWVSGEGWRRVNDLKPGSLLHTATGSVAVTAIEPVPDAAVYNVVVSPTHNYFVGDQALLTHDVTLPRPTNRKVPGLVDP